MAAGAPPSIMEMHIPLGLGLDQVTHQELVDPSRGLLQVENCGQEKKGGLTKVPGSSALTSGIFGGGSITAGYSIAPSADGLVMVDGHLAYGFGETANAWCTGDRVPECTVQRYPVPLAGDINASDCVYCGGYIFVVAQILNQAGTAYDVWAAVMDATTMVPVHIGRLGSAVPSGYVQLAATSRYVWMVYSSAANTIDIRSFDTSNAGNGWAGLVQITNWAGTTAEYGCDGVVDTGSGAERLVIAYKNNSGGASSLSVRTYSSAPALVNTVTQSAPSTITHVNVRCDSNNVVWIAYDDYAGGVGVRMIALQSALTSAYSVGTIIAAASMSSASSKLMLLNTTTTDGHLVIKDTNGMLGQKWTVAAGAVSATGSEYRWFNLTPSARPWTVGGRYYFDAGYPYAASGGPVGPAHMAIDWTDWITGAGWMARAVALIDKGLGDTRGASKYAGISSTKIGLLNLTTRSSLVQGLQIAVLDFGSSARWTSAQFNGGTYFAGGVTTYWDGAKIRESGFLARPSKPTTSTGGTGITLTNGARYVCVFEAIDNLGNVVWSAASDPSASTGAVANVTISVTCRTLAVTSHNHLDGQRDIRIAVYRTDDNGGTGPYYRVGYVTNSLAAATVVFADTTSTATLLTRATLYTDPGVIGTALNRESPPASNHLFVHQDRLVALADDGHTIFYSGPQVIGESAWFNSVMQIYVPSAGRNVAGWSQDGRMVISSESELWAIDGDGPPENGGNGTEFSIPRRLPSDVGCVDPRSVCTTTLGTFFRSRRGIELLNRGFGVEWVGEGIQTTLASYPVVTAAVLDAENGHVVFTLNASETSQQVSGGAVMAVFDLTTKTWQLRDAVGSSGYQSACMATVSGKPRLHWLKPDATMRRERVSSDGSAYLETSTWRTMTVETGAFKLAGGLSTDVDVEKVQVLYRKNTDANLLVYYAVDDSASFTLARTYTGAELNALTAPQIEIPLGNDRRCRNVRFKIVDATPTGVGVSVGTGKGYTLLGLTVVFHPPDSGGRKLASGAR